MIEQTPSSASQVEGETQSGVNGSTDAQLLDVCKACGTSAPADAMGLCANPKCRAVRKGTKLAAKHGPINSKRRQELRDRFARDYRPSSTIDEIRCKQLAAVAERLEVVKAGSPDHVRLLQTSQVLITSLEESLRASRSINQNSVSADLTGLSDEELAQRAERLAARIRGQRADAVDAEVIHGASVQIPPGIEIQDSND